jgi:Ribonuclease G/E
VTQRFFIECGSAETRAAVIDGGEFTYFWFGPARGDEHLPAPPQSGDIVLGRVKSISKALNGAFVDIGAARDGYLPLKKNEKSPVEGASIVAIVRRPPIGTKGAVLSLAWAKGLNPAAKAIVEEQSKTKSIGALGEASDAALSAFHQCARFAKASEVVVSDPAAKAVLEKHSIAVRIGGELSAKMDEAIVEALWRTMTRPHGALAHFHETEAGVLADIDSASAGEGATGSLNDKINLAAASRLPRELTRRGVGGRVIVDFLPPSGAAARAKLSETMKEWLSRIPRARYGKLSPDGLCDLTLPRERLSLLQIATEPFGSNWPVEGRRFTLDWSARSAVRALEKELVSRPSSRLRLLVGSEIGDYLSTVRPQWSARLAQKYGARFAIEADRSMESRNHEVA